jgi:hypothetical protein
MMMMDLPLMSRPSSARLLPSLVLAVLAAGAGLDAAAADQPKLLMLPSRASDPVADIRLTPASGCVGGQECAVAIATDSRIAAGDRRRLAILIDWPANLYQPARADGAWHCRPFGEEQLVCMARIDELASGAASHFTVRLPVSGDPKLCGMPLKAYDLGDGGQTRRVRLLQALYGDVRHEPITPDGQLTAETRQALAGVAKDFGVPADQDAILLAGLSGAAFNHQPVTISPCVALITPAAKAAEVQGGAMGPVGPARQKGASAKESAKVQPAGAQDNLATRNSGPAEPVNGAPAGAAAPIERPLPLPPAVVRGEPDASILVRPWRIRPLQGLRRIFGD